MSENASAPLDDDLQNTQLQKAVIVAVLPDQPARVLSVAVRYTQLLSAPLVVVHVDVTRFVTFEDPDGYVHSAPIDLNIDSGAAEFEEVQRTAAQALVGTGLTWTARQLVGDPALAIKQLAAKVDAQLIVVATRKRGSGSRSGNSSPARSPLVCRTASPGRCSWSRWRSRCPTTRRSGASRLPPLPFPSPSSAPIGPCGARPPARVRSVVAEERAVPVRT